MGVWRRPDACVKLVLVDEPVIYREEIVALLFAVQDRVLETREIRKLLEDDGEEEEDRFRE